MKRLFQLFLSLIFAFGLFVTLFDTLRPVQAADFIVSNAQDNGDGSLRQAIHQASQTAGPDSITFAPSLNGQTITLTSGSLVITTELTIDASTLTDSLRISGDDTTRVFFIASSGVATLTHLIIADGTTQTGSGACLDYCGGGIYVDYNGHLSLTHSLVTDNFGNSGGGLFNAGHTTIQDSEISHNHSNYDGAGIRADGDMTIRSSTIVSNTSNGSGGGGLYAQFSTVQILSSTIAYNQTTASGGGIAGRYMPSLILENSTIAYNTASDNGGGVILDSQYGLNTALQINNSTVSGNTASSEGGGLYVSIELSTTAVVSLTNSTFAHNSSGVYLMADGTSRLSQSNRNTLIVASGGANCVNVLGNLSDLADDGSCLGFRQGEARLAPLANNGGPTLTHLPQAGSAAMGHGETAVCQAAPIHGLDQRGIERPLAACDIGSTEVEDRTLLFLPVVRQP